METGAARQPGERVERLPPLPPLYFVIVKSTDALGAREVFTNRLAFGYTVAAGLVYGAFIGYLSSVQQILQEQYALGPRFPAYFATLAIALGGASLCNARLVGRHGMRHLAGWALRLVCAVSVLFLVIATYKSGEQLVDSNLDQPCHADREPRGDRALAARHLQRKGVRLLLGQAVIEVSSDRVGLSDGTSILTRTVVWAGGLMASPLAAHSGLPKGRGGRIDVQPDLTVAGFPGVYALGDFANVPGTDGQSLPQLASVAQQCGVWTAKNILAEIAGKPRTAFHYHDKGIMAMIGRDAAVAEIGKKRHELDGPIAFAAWLGVHALLMSGVRERIEAFIAAGASKFVIVPLVAPSSWPDELRRLRDNVVRPVEGAR
jgi:hypothetical protein